MDLKSKVMTAFVWSSSTKFLGQLISWVLTVIIIRILNPEDYGLLSMAMVFVGFLNMFSDLGLGSALIHMRSSEDSMLRRVFWIVILVDTILFVLLYFIAPLIADFYNEERLTLIVRVLALQFLLLLFEVVPRSLLERKLDFKKKSIIEILATFLGGGLTLALALSGMGVWALIYGTLFRTLLRVVGLNIIFPFLKFPIISFKGMRQVLSFGSLVSSDRILWFIYSQADILIIGKLLGKEVCGFYAVAVHLASLPMQKIIGIMNQVAFPAFSQVQSDLDKAKVYLLKAIRLVSFFAFPTFFGLSSVSNEFFDVIIGEKFKNSILPFQVLCFVMPIRMLDSLFPPAVMGLGRPFISTTNLLIATIVMPIAFYFGTDWGLTGVSLVWVIAFPPIFLVSVIRASKVTGVGLEDVFGSIVKSAVIASVMYLLVRLGAHVLPMGWHNSIKLSILVLIGATSYIGLSWTLNRHGFREAISIIGGIKAVSLKG